MACSVVSHHKERKVRKGRAKGSRQQVGTHGAIGSRMVDLPDATPLIIGAAIAVHRALGPGLLESAYSHCLFFEMVNVRGLKVEQQCPLSIVYGGVRVPCGYMMDFVVNDSVVVEIKAVETILPVHEAQMLSYLRLSGLRYGLLLNFNVVLMKHGIRRFIGKLR
jgi:GxxExxY protein